MVNRIAELGGTVRLRSRVREIIVEDKVAKGVLLDSGEVQRADLVISNMHPRVLLDHLPQGSVRRAYRNRVLGQRVGIAHLGVYMQIDGTAETIGNANIYRHFSLDPERSHDAMTVDGPLPFYFATAPNEAYEAEERRRHDVVLMLLALTWKDVARWHGTRTGQRGADYDAFKAALQQRAVDALLGDHPSLAGRVLRVESSTGLTTQHYTATPEGAMYGHYHSVDQMGKYRPSQVIRVRNLVQVGQGVFTPGVLGATLSAYYGCGFHLGLENLLAELEAA
jgi:phytoene dehydrogenase-like protein